MGQLDSTCRAPPLLGVQVERGVAARVAFERHILKPFFHLIDARVEYQAPFQIWVAMGQGESTCTGAPPRRARASGTASPPCR
jgi:hypothetical protein